MPCRLSHSLLAGLLALLAALPHARAQCGDWIIGPGQGIAGLDSIAMSSMVWHRDGPGEPPVLLVGGNFSFAGNVEADHLAIWDGTAWSAGPRGLGGGNAVHALIVHNGDLIIGGSVTTAHGQPINRVARWDGDQWHPMGEGMNDIVFELVEHQGDLYAAGAFTTAGGHPAHRIARWDGAQWHAVGEGVNNTVYAMTQWQNELYIGGSFSTTGSAPAAGFARWTGTQWEEVGGGLVVGGAPSGTGYAFAELDGDLILGGRFLRIGTTEVRNILRWNGTQATGFGDGFDATVRRVHVSNGTLIAGGAFRVSTLSNGIARWDGEEWQPFGRGYGAGSNNTVRTLATFNGELISGGAALSVGGTSSRYIARWNGNAWRTMGEFPDAPVYDFAEAPEGGIYIASQFGMHEDHPPIMRFDGSWHSVGEGLTGSGRHLGTYQGDMLLGGAILNVASTARNLLVRWDGNAWHSFGEPQGINSGISVNTTHVHQGELYVGGDFTTLEPCWRFARWGGSTWDCVSTDGGVLSLASYNGQLYAGGAFTIIDGGVPARFFAYWNGIQWQPLANNRTNGYIHSMAELDGQLILGGDFNRIGDLTAMNRVATWDGQNFSQLGSGLNDHVYAVEIFRGDLVVGGRFTTAGGQPANRLARWDGQSWSAMASVDSGTVFALRAFGDRLEVGGQFLTVDGRYSMNWATWSEETPTVNQQPEPVTSCHGGVADFHTAASGPGTLSYRWRKDGVELQDGPTSTGSTISGATTPHLQINGITIADAGSYDCIVSNPCGSTVTSAVQLDLCYANCDCSTTPPILTVDDFTCFINEFASAQSLPISQQIEHYANCDGSTTAPVLTVDDFTCFINAFAAGCP